VKKRRRLWRAAGQQVAQRVFARRRGGRVRGMDVCMIAAWNARSILRCLEVRREGITEVGFYDKVSFITSHMKSNKLNAMCVSEHHLADCAERAAEAHRGGVVEQELGDGFRLLFTRHVGVVFSPAAYQAWSDAGSKKATYGSGRVLSVEWAQRGEPWRLVSVYAPTHQHDEQTKIEFYDELTRACNVPATTALVVGGDFNARAGTRAADAEDDDLPVGIHGGARNHNGEMLVSWAGALGLKIVNSFRPLSKRGTWYHPRSKQWYELDYFITSDLGRVCRFSITEGMDSDHRMLQLSIGQRPRPRPPERAKVRKLDVSKLGVVHDAEHGLVPNTVTQNYQDRVTQLFEEKQPADWDSTAEVLVQAAEEAVGYLRRPKQDLWIEDNLEEVERITAVKREAFLERQRNLGCARKRNKYRSAKKHARTSLRRLANKWWQAKAASMDEARKLKISLDVFQNLRELIGVGPKNRCASTLKKKDGTRCNSLAEELDRWREHHNEVLNQNTVADPAAIESIEQREIIDELAAAPSLDEVRKAISKLKNRKAAGLDQVHSEMIKYGGEDVIAKVHEHLVDMWGSGSVPQSFKDPELVNVQKKGDLSLCDNWRGISLLVVCSKVLSIIMADRLHAHVVPRVVQDTQYGFRPKRSCSHAIQVIRSLMKWIDECQDEQLSLVFYDLRKFYDSIPRNAMYSVLRRFGVPEAMIRIISSMHDGAIARVRVGANHTEGFEVTGGLRQGCCLAPCLAILYMAAVVGKWREEVPTGVELAADLISCNLARPVATRRISHTVTVFGVEFADDMTAADRSIALAKAKAIVLDRICHQFGIQIAWAKTKVLVMGEAPQDICFRDHAGRDQTIEAVDSFVLLGSTVNRAATMDAEVDHRILRATRSYNLLRRRLFLNRHISLRTKAAVYRVVVLASLLYSSECWYCLNGYDHWRKLEMFNMRCVRDMCGVWRMQQHEQHITNEMLRERLQLETVQELSRQRQLAWLGHLGREEDDRLVKQATFGWIPDGTRKSYGNAPRQTFAGACHKALKERHIDKLSWYNRAKDRGSWRERVVYGIRDGDSISDGSSDDGNRPASKLPSRVRAFKAKAARPREKFTGVRNAQGRWECPEVGCNYTSDTRRGASIHYAKTHGKTQRDTAFHGSFQCPFCDFQSHRRQGLSLHITRKHRN
jgi:hypothetical protein